MTSVEPTEVKTEAGMAKGLPPCDNTSDMQGDELPEIIWHIHLRHYLFETFLFPPFYVDQCSYYIHLLHLHVCILVSLYDTEMLHFSNFFYCA